MFSTARQLALLEVCVGGRGGEIRNVGGKVLVLLPHFTSVGFKAWPIPCVKKAEISMQMLLQEG